MTEQEYTRKGWAVGISGDGSTSANDRITLTRYDPPRIRVEIDAPGIRSAGEDQVRQARQAIRDAASDLLQALETPSALPGLRQL